MTKVDLKREPEHLYLPFAAEVREVKVPAFTFLMIDGRGDPGTSQAYTEAVEALFSVSYAAKFMVKKDPKAVHYSAMPLEGLSWADDMSAFAANDRTGCRWTMMIMQPDFVDRDVLDEAVEHAPRDLPLRYPACRPRELEDHHPLPDAR